MRIEAEKRERGERERKAGEVCQEGGQGEVSAKYCL